MIPVNLAQVMFDKNVTSIEPVNTIGIIPTNLSILKTDKRATFFKNLLQMFKKSKYNKQLFTSLNDIRISYHSRDLKSNLLHEKNLTQPCLRFCLCSCYSIKITLPPTDC